MASTRKGVPDPAGRVAACLRQYPPRGGRLCVGYSGGLDSSVLLHLLAELRSGFGYTLSALHVHHGLSARADDWAAHCERACRELDVPLTVERVRVEMAGDGPEAAARAARYAVFSRLDADALALAHHRDDQAETVLAQLLRGGGPKGLAAMPMSRWLDGGRVRLLRPLLEIPRSVLESWARASGLAWVEDESNRQTHLTRNALRQDILPLIETRFPGAGATLALAAGRFAESAELLDDLADLDARDAIDASGIAIDRLAALPEARARNLLRRYLERSGATIHPESLKEGLRQLLEARGDARVAVVFGAMELRRFRGRARAVPRRARAGVDRKPGEPMARWHGEPGLVLGTFGKLAFQRVAEGGIRLDAGPVTVCSRRGGETLRPHPGRPCRAVKDLLREAAIPPWLRDELPLLYVGERLAWVAGIGADTAFMARPGESGWLVTWLAAPSP